MSDQSTKIAVAMLATLVLAGSADAQVSFQRQKGPMAFNPNALMLLQPKLKCVASGSPQEFPNDIALINSGVSTIPAGTKAAWVMPGHGSGVYVFTSALAPNKLVYLSNVLSGAVGAGTPCSVKVL